MIVVEALTRRFNHLVALDKIDLLVEKGASFALLGPNGAGKTTLVRILSTLLRPTSGKVTLNGIDILEEPEAAKQQLGVVSHNPFLYDELTAMENLEFYANLFDKEPDLSGLLKKVRLEKRAHDLVGTFSRGMKQRLSIARAVLHDPNILILDEPTAGLDISSRNNFYSLIEELKGEGKTFLLTTHYLDEAIRLCQKGVVLNKGRIMRDIDFSEPKEKLEEIFGAMEG